MFEELGLGNRVAEISLPLEVEAYRRVDPQHLGAAVTLVENWQHHHRSMLWSDLHKMFLSSLPREELFFAHEVTKIQQGGERVLVTAEHKLGDGTVQDKTFTSDLVIAADGINSFVRRSLIPTDKKRCIPDLKRCNFLEIAFISIQIR